MVDHLLQRPLTQRQQLRDDADVVLGHVDRDALDRLVLLAVDLSCQHLGLADGQLEALAAHDLDQHRELELPAALHLPDVGPRGRLDAQRDVADELLLEPADQRACGQLVAFGARQRRGVDAERHRERRLVDRRDGQRARILGIGDRLADRHLRQAGERDDLARARLLGGDAVERFGHVELGDARVLDRAVGATPGDLLAPTDRPVLDPQQREPADVGRGIEVRDQSLQRVLGVVRRRRHRRQQGLHERAEIVGELVRREAGTSLARVRVDDRELDLRFVRVEVEEELVDLVHDRLRPRVGAVDLVDDQHDRQPRLERLAQDEARLGQRPLARVDQEQDAVDHRQPALDLAAEVGVARRVDDVHLRVADLYGRVLSQDRDPLLALEIERIHDPLGHVLVGAEGTGLPEQGVDERRLPMVDMGDDRDVAKVASCSRCGHSPLGGFGGMELVTRVRCSFRGEDAGSVNSQSYWRD